MLVCTHHLAPRQCGAALWIIYVLSFHVFLPPVCDRRGTLSPPQSKSRRQLTVAGTRFSKSKGQGANDTYLEFCIIKYLRYGYRPCLSHMYSHNSNNTTLLISPWSKKTLRKSEERLNTPFIVIDAIFRSLIIKLARKHSRIEINTKI